MEKTCQLNNIFSIKNHNNYEVFRFIQIQNRKSQTGSSEESCHVDGGRRCR